MGDLLDTFHKNAIHITARRKDGWDKASVVLALVSAISVAAISALTSWLVATRQAEQALTQLKVQNEQFQRSAEQKSSEIRVSGVQTIEKFFPHLQKDPVTKKAVIEVIATIDPGLSARLGLLYFKEGGREALGQAARSSDPAIARPAQQALVQQLSSSLTRRSEAPKSTVGDKGIEEVKLRGSGDISLVVTAGYGNTISYRVELYDQSGQNPRSLGEGNNLNQQSGEYSVGRAEDLIGRIVLVSAVVVSLQSGPSTGNLTIEFKQSGTIVEKVVRSQNFTGTWSVVDFRRFVGASAN